MKVKKIVVSLTAILLFVIMFASQTVFAALTPVDLTFMELNASNDGSEYGLGASGPRITKIGNQSGARLVDYYCGFADAGFENRNGVSGADIYKDHYNAEYEMNDENKTSVQAMQVSYKYNNTVTTTRLYLDDRYNQIRALADLFYLGTDDAEYTSYIRELLDESGYLEEVDLNYRQYKNGDYTASEVIAWYNENNPTDTISTIEEYMDRLVKINAEELRAVQQAAIWYFSNGDSYDKTGLGAANYLLYSKTSAASSYTAINSEHNRQALAIYKYLINKAKTNATSGIYGTNKVYLYVDTTTTDEQPILKIVKGTKNFDLALRKFITKINNVNVTTSREPVITDEEKAKLSDGNATFDDGTTLEKDHTKTPLAVTKGDTVLYTIRIYNEGEVDGYAEEVTDYLPEGLDLATNSTINSTYEWSQNGRVIKTTHLSKTKGESINLIKAFNKSTKALDYRDLLIECVVNNNATSSNLKNVAEITESKDKNGNTTDIDSTTNNLTSTQKSNYNVSTSTKGKGYEDDDDYEDLVLNKFDLALRKFIVKINNDNVTTSREPIITDAEKTKLSNGNATFDDGTTLEKDHTKAPLGVSKGDTVLYTIRIYNEGEVDGYAEEVTDYLPAGLTMVPYTVGDGSINDTFGWSANGNKITTDYLSKAKGETANLIKAFNKSTKALDYRDLQIECVVNNNATSSNLKNVAEITESKDKNGNTEDKDSTTNNLTDSQKSNYNASDSTRGKGYEDDDDYENLKLVEFDLALRKYITKVENKDGENVTVSNLDGRTPNIDKDALNNPNTTAEYKHRKDPVVVKPGYFVYYNLTVYNEGDIAGRATKIVDTLPEGVKFISVESGNFETYSTTNNTLILVRKSGNTTNLAPYTGQENLASETVVIKCEVTADKENGSDKIYTNIAWIAEDANVKGTNVTDRDSEPTTHPTETNLVTSTDNKGYIGNSENASKTLSNKNEHFKGEQDDDDFEKIVIYKTPEIHKGVKTVKNQDSGYDEDVNTPHKWVINSTIPSNVENYKKYVITDDIDYRLDFVPNSVKVYAGNNEQSTAMQWTDDNLLEEGVDYELEYTPHTGNDTSTILGNKYSGTLKLTFIDTENRKNPSDKINAKAGGTIVVVFNTTFAKDENGKLLAEIIGKEIPNKAKLDYKNESGEEEYDESEQPEVHTGGITLFKYYDVDGEKVGLEDAEFEIYRTENDAKNKTNAVKTATSQENGLVEFVGLEYGEDAQDDENNLQEDGTYDHDSNKMSTKYWIVETKAPKGYKTITTPIEVLINNDSYRDDISVLVREEESKTTSARLVENKPLDFDLSLRKFITDVNGKAPKISREPVVDTTKLKNGTATTAEYKHTKDPVEVVNGNIVTYTIRVYNEGQIDGYAEIVTDDIPEGVEFLPENSTNKEYRWGMFEEVTDESKLASDANVVECKVTGSDKVKKYVETDDAKKAAIIRTDYLSKAQSENNLLKAYDPETDKLDFKDLKAVFKVTEKNGSKRTITNYAQISEDSDKDGRKVNDRDSVTDRWNEGEDDQDVEHLILPEFDLALRKWVTQAIVIENGETTVTETGHDAWDDPEEIVKVELHRKKLSDVTVKFRYSIRVYNQGEIEGYAKEITDYIPEGLMFVAEDNPGWTDEGNNVISTKLLENTLLKPGDFADVEVLLTWINSEDNLGLKVNTAEISKDYNEKGVADKDSVPDNKKPGEDDIDDAPVMLSVSTGEEKVFIIIGIAAGTLIVLAGGIFLIKKYVL